MKKTLVALIVLNVCSTSTAFAAADAGTWYGGAKLGWSHYFDASGDKDFNDNLSNSTDFDFDKDNIGGGVFTGYQMTPWLAVEGGYDYLGNMEVHGNNGTAGGKLESQGLQLSLKASYGITDNWDIYGRGGAMAYRAESNNAGHSRFETGVRPLAAVGTEYAFNKNWAGRVEYQWVSNVGNSNQIGVSADVSSVTAGVVYRFSQHDDAPEIVAAPVTAPAPAAPESFNLQSDVMFAFNSAQLSEDGQAAVRDLYSRPEIQSSKDKTTMVIGYTDRLGSPSYNQDLSSRRAQAVADELVRLGMPAQNVQAKGRGSNETITGNKCDSVSARNDLVNCLAPDRRVVINISGQHS